MVTSWCCAESPDFYCNDCIKLKRPSYGRQLDHDGNPVVDSDAESDDAEEDDEEDDEYWMREDSDERAFNKALPLANTPQLGQCGVRGEPNRSCYDHEDINISQRVMWQW